MDRVRVGVIGTGGMGQAHCRLLRELEETELTAVCDIDPEVLEKVKEEYEVPGFLHYEELLDSGLVDAVTIATPHYFHPPIAIAAFQRGLHVLSEKPIGVTVKAADEMIRAARESGKKFAVMFQMRTAKYARLARKAIDEGIVGKLQRATLIMAWYRTQAYYESATWRATWSGEGGGVLLNQAPHDLDLFTWLVGMPAKVTAQVRTRLHDIEVEDETFALLEFPNGAHGYIYATVNEVPGVDRFEIVGDKGKVLIDGGQTTIYRLERPISQFTVESEEMWGKIKAEEVTLEVPDAPSGHGAILQNFARAILYDEPLIVPGEEGIRSLELANAILLSGKRNKTVHLPVDRDEYEELIESLKVSSRPKRVVAKKIETDPNLARGGTH
jgi:predicted dehydrogenase